MDYILNKKWVGVVAVLVGALFVTLSFIGVLTNLVSENVGFVEAEVGQFLPITISNGEIVEPENTVISKRYGDYANVVLDTRSSDIDIDGEGVYVSKNKIYVVNRDKTTIYNLNRFPNTELTKEKAFAFMEQYGHYSGWTKIGLLILLVMAALGGVTILFYTITMHWLVHIIVKADYARTLRINTLAFVAFTTINNILSFITDININIGVAATWLLLLVVNLIVGNVLKKEE